PATHVAGALRASPPRGRGLDRRPGRPGRLLVVSQTRDPSAGPGGGRAALLERRLLLRPGAHRLGNRPVLPRAADARLAVANVVREGAALGDRAARGGAPARVA